VIFVSAKDSFEGGMERRWEAPESARTILDEPEKTAQSRELKRSRQKLDWDALPFCERSTSRILPREDSVAADATLKIAPADSAVCNSIF
jgi:hypothetical protein